MTTLFLVCAGLGCLVMVVQLLAGVVGLDHHDFSHQGGGDHGGLFFGILSVRAISAAFAAFGLAGMAAHTANLGDTRSILIGALAGVGMMGVVMLLLRWMRKLSASGTIETSRAVDQIGTVYVAVPGNFAGQGKVQVDVQDRTVELIAVTHGPPLTTGTRVRVVQVVNGGTAEVIGVGLG